MAESTLTAAFNELQAAVGFFLGFGRGSVAYGDPAWDARQQATIDYCTKGGQALFYFCGHDWSFLRPVSTLALDSGTNALNLPDDFGGVEGPISLSAATTIVWFPLETTLIERVYLQEAQNPTTTGRPVMAAVEALKGTSGTQGTRFRLRVWPKADQAYTLKFQYYVLPDAVNGSLPYLLGGAAHRQTVLAACKAVAELDLDDVTDGPQQLEFRRLLEQSKDLDRRNKPQNLGYNGDRSDLRDGRRWPWADRHGDALVSYRGVVPG